MGSWGLGPWDNDRAADWREEIVGAFDVRERWLRALDSDPVFDSDLIRSAVALFRDSSRNGEWPSEYLETDRLHASAKLGEVLAQPWVDESPRLRDVLRAELAELVAEDEY